MHAHDNPRDILLDMVRSGQQPNADRKLDGLIHGPPGCTLKCPRAGHSTPKRIGVTRKRCITPDELVRTLHGNLCQNVYECANVTRAVKSFE